MAVDCDWRQMWPDVDTIVKSNIQTLISYNNWLPEAKTSEEQDLWTSLRQRFLYSTRVKSSVLSIDGVVQCSNLLELHKTNEFPINLITPYVGKLDYKGVESVVLYYIDTNTRTNSFVYFLVKSVIKNYGKDYAKAIFFPHLKDVKNNHIELMFDIDNA